MIAKKKQWIVRITVCIMIIFLFSRQSDCLAENAKNILHIETVPDSATIKMDNRQSVLQEVYTIVGNSIIEKAQMETSSDVAQDDDIEASAVISYSKEDYNSLLKIVEAEAGVCDEKGKVLVANVIINRVNSSAFPDTITEVVYQNNGNTYQFSPVLDGSIDTVKISEQTKEAVKKALYGKDYSEGALYFAARSHSSVKNMSWFDSSLEFLFEHDGHEFFTDK